MPNPSQVESLQSAIICAFEMEWLSIVKETIPRLENHNCNFRDAAGKNPLHHAVIGGGDNPDLIEDYSDVVTLLISRKTELDAKDNKGKTPLHYAAQTGNINAVALLVNAGADIKAYDITRKIGTPLTLAEKSNKTICAKILSKAASQQIAGERPFISREFLGLALEEQQTQAAANILRSFRERHVAPQPQGIAR